jgi:hypothetical protein
MVDSTNQAVLLGSTEARLIVDGSDWDTIDLSDNTNSYKIQAGWLDGNDLWLVMCDNDGTADDFEVCFIELDDSNDCNPVAVSAGADNNTVYAYDIFKIGSNHYVINTEERAASGVPIIVVWDVDAAFVEKDTWTGADCQTAGNTFNISPGVVISQKAYFNIDFPECADIIMFWYDDAITTIVEGDDQNGYSAPSRSQQSMAYDGSNIFHFVVNKDGDGLDYRAEYSVSGDLITVKERFDIAFQLDRNNSATVPNELEKAFATDSVETVYEIKARRGGINILQDISSITDAVIIALTDNYLMNNDGDLFKFTDVESEVSEIYQSNGIIGIPNKVVMKIHPDYENRWSEGDSYKVYDSNDVLEFWGIIDNKSINATGEYVLQVDSFTNEVYRATYEKSYSADDLDTKQKDIIDNGLTSCYRSSSIVGTATTFDYDYNRAVAYMFNLGRFLERQVPYIEPDGKIWTKAYDGLTATGESWDLNDGDENKLLVDIPYVKETIPGYHKVKLNITRTVVRYKNNTTATRPTTYATAEQTKGVIPLEEFRDSKIEASTEANQLGDNLYNIFSAETEFVGLRISGKGYLQPGKTITIVNTGQITISSQAFCILQYKKDVKNDIYIYMVLSDNIIFPEEIATYNNTIDTQVSQTVIQALENQNDIATNVTDISSLEAFLGIGDANSQWIGLPYYGSTSTTRNWQVVNNLFRNLDGTDSSEFWIIPLPCNRGSYSLKLKNLRMWVEDADADDKIDAAYIYAVQDDWTQDQLFADLNDVSAPTTPKTWDLSDIDCDGYIQVMVRLTFVVTTAFDFDSYGLYLEYYYS